MTSWQPIETAPRDGKWILAVKKNFIPAVARWDKSRGSFEFMEPDYYAEEEHYLAYLDQTDPWDPTHWMPLPEPPND